MRYQYTMAKMKVCFSTPDYQISMSYQIYVASGQIWIDYKMKLYGHLIGRSEM